MRTRLPVIRVTAPCDVGWDNLVGDERIRFCGHCEKQVYNLTVMSRDEIAALVATGGERCVRIRKPKRMWAAVAALLLGFVGIARADTSVPKDKHEKTKTTKANTKEAAKKKPPPEFTEGLMAIDL
jgi:hypothetical protein